MNFIAPDKMKSQTLRYDFIFLNYTQFFLQNIWEFLNKLWGQISFFRLQSTLRKSTSPPEEEALTEPLRVAVKSTML